MSGTTVDMLSLSLCAPFAFFRDGVVTCFEALSLRLCCKRVPGESSYFLRDWLGPFSEPESLPPLKVCFYKLTSGNELFSAILFVLRIGVVVKALFEILKGQLLNSSCRNARPTLCLSQRFQKIMADMNARGPMKARSKTWV